MNLNRTDSTNETSVNLLQNIEKPYSLNTSNFDQVAYDGLVITHRESSSEERPYVNSSVKNNTKTLYSSEKVNQYFATRPLARQKADEIQYNLDKLEIIGRGHSGVVYEIPDNDRVLKVVRQAFNVA